MKNKFLILICFLMFNSLILTDGNASLRPIIVSNNPSSISTDSNSISLSWNIIDDNPRFYSIKKNGSILINNISIVSDIVNFEFIEIAGTYNISFTVYDFSGFFAQDYTLITISAVTTSSSTSATGSSTSSSSSATTSSTGSASPGFTYINTLIMIVLISLPILRKKWQRKQT